MERMADPRKIWIYCFILETTLLYTGQTWIQPCLGLDHHYIRTAEVGENVTFDLCVSSSDEPEKIAYFEYRGQCRQNQSCFGNKLKWTLRRVEGSDNYRVTIEIFSVQPPDFTIYNFNLMGPSFRSDRSDRLKWIFELRGADSDKTPVKTTKGQAEVTFPSLSKEPWTVKGISPSSPSLPSSGGSHTSKPFLTKPPALSSLSPTSFLLASSLSPKTTTNHMTISSQRKMITRLSTSLPPQTRRPTTSQPPQFSRSTTTDTSINSQCFSENSTNCPTGWALIGNSACLFLSPSPASWSVAKATCQRLDSHLPSSLQLKSWEFQRCIPDIQSIWIEESGAQSFQRCHSYRISSSDVEQTACEKKLPFFCSLRASSYDQPKVVSFGLDLYTSLNDVDNKLNRSLTLYKSLNISGQAQRNVLIDAEVTHIRVTCHAQGLPKPEVVMTSTLIGETEPASSATEVTNGSFLYRRPISLFGALGSVRCDAKNIYGDVVSSWEVDIGAALEARILSFTSPAHQLQKGDKMELRCATIGFPSPKMRIFQENSGLLMNASAFGKNLLEYNSQRIDCEYSGWYRCEVEDIVVGKIKVMRTHVEVKKCPPACPKEFRLDHEPNNTMIQLSWIPSFNGGAHQSFNLFVSTNDSKWRQLTPAIVSDVTYIWRNISEFSAETNYSFRIVPTNIYVTGEPDSSRCRKTVHFFCTQRVNQFKENRLSDDSPFRSGRIDYANIAIGVAAVLLVGISVIALLWYRIRKGRLRRLRTALESLSRLISFSESNVEASTMSKTSSSSSVFETSN